MRFSCTPKIFTLFFLPVVSGAYFCYCYEVLHNHNPTCGASKDWTKAAKYQTAEKARGKKFIHNHTRSCNHMIRICHICSKTRANGLIVFSHIQQSKDLSRVKNARNSIYQINIFNLLWLWSWMPLFFYSYLPTMQRESFMVVSAVASLDSRSEWHWLPWKQVEWNIDCGLLGWEVSVDEWQQREV